MPLMGLATMNAFVHVVMYAYYLAAAMRLEPPLWWVVSEWVIVVGQLVGRVAWLVSWYSRTTNLLLYVLTYHTFFLTTTCFRWKRKITALQLFQFSIGGCGATYFWAHYFI